jgi:hypothetical protein
VRKKPVALRNRGSRDARRTLIGRRHCTVTTKTSSGRGRGSGHDIPFVEPSSLDDGRGGVRLWRRTQPTRVGERAGGTR